MLHTISTNPYVIKLLQSYGIKSPEDYRLFDPPSLLPPESIYDIENASALILKAIKKKHKILIYGDYDADGILSSYILYDFLSNKIGYKNIAIHLPSRFKEGYGLTEKALEVILKQSPNLLITVDTGITFYETIDKIRKRKIDVIVVDHHSLPAKLPPANVIVHPQHPKSKTPYKQTSATSVAYRLLIKLAKLFSINKTEDYLDLVGLSLVTDVMPITGENRYLIKKTLNKMKHTPHPKLATIMKQAGYTKTDLFLLGNIIGPRFNAPGRLETPIDTLNYLLEDGKNSEELAKMLDQKNTKRQQLTLKYVKIASENIKVIQNQIVISIVKDLPEGIAGLIASKLVELFQKPVLVFAQNGKFIKGSARSTASFNIIAFLETLRDYFEELGGHPQAAGYTISDTTLKKLIDFLEKNTIEWNKFEIKTETAPLKVTPDELGDLLFEAIEVLKPYGPGFEYPRLEVTVKTPLEIYYDKNNSHTFIRLNNKVKGVIWNKIIAPPSQYPFTLTGKLKRSLFNGSLSYLFVVDKIGSGDS